MSKEDVAETLRTVVDEYKKVGYEDLKKWVENKKVKNIEIKGKSGTSYQVELSAFTDDKKRGTIRFVGSIHLEKSTWHDFFKSSINYDFIIAPDNSFIDE